MPGVERTMVVLLTAPVIFRGVRIASLFFLSDVELG
jgi:hypothetical protein